jgi:bla regulator protein BlaR1
VFWFHPLVWWIGKRMAVERERACDEEVLRLGTEPRVYAEAILHVCALCVRSPLVCVSGMTGADLKQRIEAIVARRGVAELSFARKAGLACAGLASLALPVWIGALHAPPMLGEPQSSIAAPPAAGEKFRRVSIRPCLKYTEPSAVTNPSPGRLLLNCQTVMRLIDIAYAHPGSISGGPTWIMSAAFRYRIDARADDGASLDAMKGPMLQALLEERFHLKIRRLTRVWVAANGARLQPFKEGGGDGPLSLKRRGVPGELQYARLEGQGMSLDDFCGLLAGALGRPVIDKTGIRGRFDFRLKFADDETPRLLRPLYPPLFSVVEEQLGLSLEQFTGQREFLVIDQVEMPRPG